LAKDRARDPKKLAARWQIYYEVHRAEILQRARDYRLAHPFHATPESRARSAAWKKAHPEAARADYVANRDGYLRRAIARRVRERGAPGSYTAQEWRDKVELLGGCCIYCGRDDVKLGPDHKVPLSRGGSNDIENIVPACRSCNSRKRTRTAHEYLGLAAA
jgi:5-methylcytosine-specific restriction endonuclease McrA